MISSIAKMDMKIELDIFSESLGGCCQTGCACRKLRCEKVEKGERGLGKMFVHKSTSHNRTYFERRRSKYEDKRSCLRKYWPVKDLITSANLSPPPRSTRKPAAPNSVHRHILRALKFTPSMVGWPSWCKISLLSFTSAPS
jgi:hypothetical protein